MNQIEYNNLPGINWSRLKHYATSPLAYRTALDAPPYDSPALLFGRAVHAAILEPEHFDDRYVIRPDFGDLRSSKNRAARDDWAAGETREILTPDQADGVRHIVRSVSAHAVAGPLLRSSHSREHVLQWRDAGTGLACKGRIDAVAETGELISVKTTRFADPDAFGREFIRRMYHGQTAYYLDGHGRAHSEVVIVAQSVAPHDVWVLDVPNDLVDVGRDLYTRLLEEHAHCEASGTWPGAVPTRCPLPVPMWALPGEDDDLSDLELEP